jgi:hypothetical protein
MNRITPCLLLAAAVGLSAAATAAHAQYPPRYCPQRSASLRPTPPPIPYTGARYSFYSPSYYYTDYNRPDYNAPMFYNARYRNPGPYFFTPNQAYTGSYYGYYYTPGYFRY